MKQGNSEAGKMGDMEHGRHGEHGEHGEHGGQGGHSAKKKVERSVFNPSDRFLRCRTMISLVKATGGTNYSNLLFSVLGDTGIRNANLL